MDGTGLERHRQVLEPSRKAAYRGRPFFFLAETVSDDLSAWWQESPSERKPLEAPPPAPFSGRVGGLAVRWWPVDHSIPAAVAFAVETGAGRVAYTGDIRFHGHGRAASEALKQAWAEMGIDVLLD